MLKKLTQSFTKMVGKNQRMQTTDSSLSSFESDKTIEPILGTPFACAKKDENRFVVIFGEHMITAREFTSRKQATDWVYRTDWITILNVVGIYVDHVLKEKNISTQTKKA